MLPSLVWSPLSVYYWPSLSHSLLDVTTPLGTPQGLEQEYKQAVHLGMQKVAVSCKSQQKNEKHM